MSKSDKKNEGGYKKGTKKKANAAVLQTKVEPASGHIAGAV